MLNFVFIIVVEILEKFAKRRFPSPWNGNWVHCRRPKTKVNNSIHLPIVISVNLIFRFPPKNARPDKNALGGIVLPSPSLAESDIWDDSIRLGLKKLKFKQADLDARRSKVPITIIFSALL